MPRPKPTQKDVANAANVSQGLVSLVLNNADIDVAEATRIRILSAAKRLGYVPRLKAGGKPKKSPSPEKRGKTIAYIPPTLRQDALDGAIYHAYEEFYDKVQNRLVEAAYKKGCSLIVRPYENSTELTSWLIEWGVEGVILHANDKSLAEWVARRYPLVQVNRRLVPDGDSVMPNQEEMIRIAMDHLRQHGHERIAFATRAKGDYAIKQRKEAYLEYCEQANLKPYEEFLSCESLETMVGRFFEYPVESRPTAVITGDPSALLLQKEALHRGLSLPADLSVIGIDNISADAFAHPPLTSIDIQTDEISRVALSLMMERIENPSLAFQKTEVAPKLVVRNSVASPAKCNPARFKL